LRVASSRQNCWATFKKRKNNSRILFTSQREEQQLKEL